MNNELSNLRRHNKILRSLVQIFRVTGRVEFFCKETKYSILMRASSQGVSKYIASVRNRNSYSRREHTGCSGRVKNQMFNREWVSRLFHQGNYYSGQTQLRTYVVLRKFCSYSKSRKQKPFSFLLVSIICAYFWICGRKNQTCSFKIINCQSKA